MVMALLNRDAVVAHPLRSGLIWATLTAVLAMLITSLVGVRTYSLDEAPKLLVIWAIAGVVWGYATRWALLRKAGRAN
jgi:hypothetical protein